MKNRKFKFGSMQLEITSADSVALLNEIGMQGIQLKDVAICGDLVLQLEISKTDYKKLLSIAQKHGASVKIKRISGVYWVGKAILKRPILLAVFTVILFLTMYLPGRVLFISVDGNTSIPAERIVEVAAECGIRFGISRRKIRSEALKNALLQKIPQLQWAGINTSGCTAVISVREKTTQKLQTNQDKGVCSIIASVDGVIQNCTVYEGNLLCSVGQAVKAGQTLVSGYIDCGIITKATRANAEINALTFRQLDVVAPVATAIRGELRSVKTVYSLRVGKKLINFSKDSGNSDISCAKIYSERYMYLPGGFRLPVAVIKQTLYYYDFSDQIPTAADSQTWLDGVAQKHLESAMIAGKVISANTDINVSDAACYLHGKYTCTEMIGQVKYEQTMLKDGEND